MINTGFQEIVFAINVKSRDITRKILVFEYFDEMIRSSNFSTEGNGLRRRFFFPTSRQPLGPGETIETFSSIEWPYLFGARWYKSERLYQNRTTSVAELLWRPRLSNRVIL